MVSTFIAMNIVCDEHNIDSNGGLPIIFYWDGKSDMKEDFKNDISFIDMVYDSCFEYDIYENSYLALVYVDNNVKEHKFKTEKIEIQKLFTFEYISGFLKSNFIYTYVNDILKDLYYKIYKTDFTEYVEDSKECLKNMFDKIMEYEKSPSVDTILNYILTKLNETNLSEENKRWLIKTTKEIIEE